MTIGVISDTHGNFQKLLEAGHLLAHVDILVHLGDYYRDACAIRERTGLRVEAVAGNTDHDEFPPPPRETILEIEGSRILITHGDIYKVKQGLELLYDRAVETGVNAVLFGHTHIPDCRHIGKVLFVNPGAAISDNGGNGFAFLTVSAGRIEGKTVTF